MATPLTQTQLPLESILDLNGKQTYLGNSFLLPMPGGSLTNTDETPFVVISNASTNKKSLFLFRRNISSNNNQAIVRYYKNATLNVAGTATTALNLRSGMSTISISTCYLAATITANGTLIGAIPTTVSFLGPDLFYVIDPGANILITAQQAGAGTSVIYIENAWYEI